METFKITEGFGSYCNECGKQSNGKTSNTLTVNGVSYTLCDDCFKRFIGQLYMAKESIFDELIATIAKKDKAKILRLINK